MPSAAKPTSVRARIFRPHGHCCLGHGKVALHCRPAPSFGISRQDFGISRQGRKFSKVNNPLVAAASACALLQECEVGGRWGRGPAQVQDPKTCKLDLVTYIYRNDFHHPIHRRMLAVLHLDPVLGAYLRTFPLFRLIQCNRVQALHMTPSYSLSSTTSSSSSRQCWTFRFVEGQVKRKFAILPR
jgi:hypothetical protein